MILRTREWQKGGRHDAPGLKYQLIDAQLHLISASHSGRCPLARSMEDELTLLFVTMK